MKENGRRGEYRSYRKYGRVRSALHRWMAVMLGIVLLAGQLDISVYAMEEPAVYSVPAADDTAEQEMAVEYVPTEQAAVDTDESDVPDQDGEIPGKSEREEEKPGTEEQPAEGGNDGDDLTGEEEKGEGGEGEAVAETAEDEDTEAGELISIAEEAKMVSQSETRVSTSFKVDGFTYYVLDEERHYVSVQWINWPGEGTLTIPDTVTWEGQKYTVTEVHRSGFWQSQKMTKVVIPDTITVLGEGAFRKCPNLSEVVFSQNLTEIEKEAFKECESLQTVILPESIDVIGYGAFEKCKQLTTVRMPDKKIAYNAGVFVQCVNLTNIEGIIKPPMTEIPMTMFSGCRSLTEVTIPNSITRIGPFAFSQCENLIILRVAVTVTEEGSVSPISCMDSEAFTQCPEDRRIIFLEADGKNPLAGDDLAAAVKAYDKVTDNHEFADDGKWYGWNLPAAGPHTITATATTGGTIAPSGNVLVAEGDDQTFTITPNKGYQLKSIVVDGEAVQADGESEVITRDAVVTAKKYTFANVQNDHTIAVSFEKASGGDTLGDDTPPGGDDTPPSGGGDTPPGGGSDNDAALMAENADAQIIALKADPAKATPAADSPAAPKNTQGKEPKTGDSTHVEIYATIAMIAGFTYLLLYFIEERHGMTEREKEVFVAAFIRWAKKGGTFRKCCALAAIFCILAYYHSVGKRTGGQVCPAQN